MTFIIAICENIHVAQIANIIPVHDGFNQSIINDYNNHYK